MFGRGAHDVPLKAKLICIMRSSHEDFDAEFIQDVYRSCFIICANVKNFVINGAERALFHAARSPEAYSLVRTYMPMTLLYSTLRILIPFCGFHADRLLLNIKCNMPLYRQQKLLFTTHLRAVGLK